MLEMSTKDNMGMFVIAQKVTYCIPDSLGQHIVKDLTPYKVTMYGTQKKLHVIIALNSHMQSTEDLVQVWYHHMLGAAGQELYASGYVPASHLICI